MVAWPLGLVWPGLDCSSPVLLATPASTINTKRGEWRGERGHDEGVSGDMYEVGREERMHCFHAEREVLESDERPIYASGLSFLSPSLHSHLHLHIPPLFVCTSLAIVPSAVCHLFLHTYSPSSSPSFTPINLSCG